MTTFGLSDKITFGKYSTKVLRVAMTIEEIIEENHGYLLWCIDNIDSFELDDEAEGAVIKKDGDNSYPPPDYVGF